MQIWTMLGSGGRRALRVGLPLVVGLSSLACGPTLPQLRAKAAQDFNCPQSELDLAHVDSKTMYVSGCGYEATYSTCKKDDECSWKADTPIKDQMKQ